MAIDYRTGIVLENVANSSGWENATIATDSGCVTLSSSLCDTHVTIRQPSDGIFSIGFESCELYEKMRSELGLSSFDAIRDLDVLLDILKRASVVASALPESPYKEYLARIKNLDMKDTEKLAQIKERIGQDVLRDALMHFWKNRCALTGVDQPELLIASHVKPWADCATGEERLNVFNGFLFEARIDRLFDQGFISFEDDGVIIISPSLSGENRKALGIFDGMRIAGIQEAHARFLAYHREHLFRRNSA